jgi:hypothetical protein
LLLVLQALFAALGTVCRTLEEFGADECGSKLEKPALPVVFDPERVSTSGFLTNASRLVKPSKNGFQFLYDSTRFDLALRDEEGGPRLFENGIRGPMCRISCSIESKG